VSIRHGDVASTTPSPCSERTIAAGPEALPARWMSRRQWPTVSRAPLVSRSAVTRPRSPGRAVEAIFCSFTCTQKTRESDTHRQPVATTHCRRYAA